MITKINLLSLFSGLIFSIGLGISGMMNPNKVQGFLDLSGRWDPSLALVMGGALLVTFFIYPLIIKRKEPIFEENFDLPKNKKIDKNLLIGSFLFGIGSAIGGLCPGPALANIAILNPNIILFVIAMLMGFFIHTIAVSYLLNKSIK